jgi:hypothetical protein
MSLRAFHLFFIALSVVLAAFVAAWAASEYRARHELTYAIGAAASIAAAGGLIAYGAAFQRKTRHLLALLMVMAVPRAAFACPVCFGQSDSPMASAANLSILVMLVITVSVLAGFASFFIYLIRQARAAARRSAEASGYGGISRSAEASRYMSGEGTIQC